MTPGALSFSYNTGRYPETDQRTKPLHCWHSVDTHVVGSGSYLRFSLCTWPTVRVTYRTSTPPNSSARGCVCRKRIQRCDRYFLLSFPFFLYTLLFYPEFRIASSGEKQRRQGRATQSANKSLALVKIAQYCAKAASLSLSLSLFGCFCEFCYRNRQTCLYFMDFRPFVLSSLRTEFTSWNVSLFWAASVSSVTGTDMLVLHGVSTLHLIFVTHEAHILRLKKSGVKCLCTTADFFFSPNDGSLRGR